MQRGRRRVRGGDSTRRLFTCTQDGCGKSFSRSEHLHRHQKNHTDGDATCPRCRAHFKRQDLLERHMSRHKQKDDEAGGEGTGTLNTRKRMWKDHDGRIVQKKPSENPSLSTTSVETPLASSQVEGPISPPVSSNSDQPHENEVADSAFPTGQSLFPDYSLPSDQFESQGSGGYWIQPEASQPRSVVPPYLDVNYDEVFQPDTASSFNMPYTTQINYDWLFSLDHSVGSTDVSQAPYVSATSIGSYSCGMQQPSCLELSQVGSSREARHCDSSTTKNPLTSVHSLDYAPPKDSGSAHSQASPSLSDEPQRSLSPPAKQVSLESVRRTLDIDYERPLATIQPSTCLPFIDGHTYIQILETIKAARPLAPNGSFLDANHPLLSYPLLQSYCDLYFTRFNAAYPLIHQATFEPSKKEPLLLLSIILLGATYSEKEAHQLAVCVHDVIRPAIFSHASFNPKPDLWMLQTILLVECFGKSRAGQKQHDMSHLFHGMLINLIRRSDCQSVRPNRPCDGDCREDLASDRSWRQWVEAEEKKRLALLCFMWDTQHAVLFCQSLCMSAFELKLPLPCSQALWEASTAAEWSRLSLSTVYEPMYLLALKSYITLDTHRVPLHNSLSRIIIFHGLMSIFWDMRRRDQTSLGVLSQGGRWQSRLAAAYEVWKGDFDSFCIRLENLTFAEISKGAVSENARAELDVWRTAYVAVYHAAHVLLHSEFLDIQIFAGARHILGRSVQRADFVRSEKVVKRWAINAVRTSESAEEPADAAFAAWHAAQLLQNASRTLVDFDSMGLFHVPWCLYLATLTIWTFHHTGARGSGSGPDGDSELVWDAQAEMRAVIGSMVEVGVEGLSEVQGMKRTGGLVWVMAEVLSKVRWGIVHAGVTVLRGLVPWRLISQFDDSPA